jgi:transposase
MLPKEYGSSSTTCHRRFQEWVLSNIFQKLWVRLMKLYNDLRGIKWTWQSLYSISVKAPLGEMTDWSKSYRQIEVNLEPSGMYYSRSKRHSIIS